MRISDWSSDVCSSDLAATAKIVGVSPSRIGQIEDKAFRRIRWVCNNIDIHDRSALDALIARRRDEAAEAERIRKRDALQKALDQERKRKAKQDREEVRRERKSGVWGKSVSERVSRGGRRSITTKKMIEPRSRHTSKTMKNK